jgi:hypothetical protein
MKKVPLLERRRQAAARRNLMKLRKKGAYVGDIISPSGDTWNAELPGPTIAAVNRVTAKSGVA